ncbi:aromatase/cyclase [Streptomyces sp. NPDC050560]|uniref:aromatase/cyclase n=1 Tax=Streptomyces sp. NPDC050560 TaxID=3365630 RepID=UPI00378791A2
MAQQEVRHTEHTVVATASADVLYDIIADVTVWPAVFGPTLHAERVESDGAQERIRLWALANGEVKTWLSRRTLDAGARRVAFRQEVSQPPVASMGGEWIMKPATGGDTLVVMTHDYTPVDDDPGHADWIARAVDRNSRAELAALKAAVERGPGLDRLMMAFEDSVEIAAPPVEVYDFIRDCGAWPERLPHVARLELREEPGGVQHLAMDTKAPDGSVHTTESIRLCFPSSHIVYKQTTLPKVLLAHTGRWSFTPSPTGTVATSQHTVVIDPDAVTAVLGADATVADARAAVRGTLGTNSTATLRLAQQFTEAPGEAGE